MSILENIELTDYICASNKSVAIGDEMQAIIKGDFLRSMDMEGCYLSASCSSLRSGMSEAELASLFCGIETIPIEVMVKIFELLPIVDRIRCERVCRRWYRIMELTWMYTHLLSYRALKGFTGISPAVGKDVCSDVVIPFVPNGVGFNELVKVARRCGKYLKELNLETYAGHLDLMDDGRFLVLCPNLRLLNLNGISLSSRCVLALGKHCPLLEDINFRNCFLQHPNIEELEQDLCHFFKRSRHLKNIDLVNCFDNIAAAVTLSGLPWCFTLPRSVRILNIGYIPLTRKIFDALAERCPELDTLLIGHHDVLEESDFHRSLAQLHRLRRLRIERVWFNNTIGLDTAIGLMQNLVELVIGSGRLDYPVLHAIGEGCTQLKLLDITHAYCDVGALVEIAKLPRLTCLSLPASAEADEFEDILLKICDRGILRVLFLTQFASVGDFNIFDILKRCKQLTCLCVSYSDGLSAATLETLKLFIADRKKNKVEVPLTPSDIDEGIGDSLIVWQNEKSTGFPPIYFPKPAPTYEQFCQRLRSSLSAQCCFADFRSILRSERSNCVCVGKDGFPKFETHQCFPELHFYVCYNDFDVPEDWDDDIVKFHPIRYRSAFPFFRLAHQDFVFSDLPILS